MLIEFSSVINNINNSIYSTPLLNKILTNVIYTAIVLSIILLVLLLFILPCKPDTSGWIIVKLFIYLSIINTFVLSTFQNTTLIKCKEKYIDIASNDVIDSINNKTGGMIYHKDNIRVVPNLTKIDESYDYDVGDQKEASVPKNITVNDMLDSIEAQI